MEIDRLRETNGDDLQRIGPVHDVTVEQLPSRARRRLYADYGIAVSGVAGHGDRDGRPVGEAFSAIAFGLDGAATRHQLDASRNEMRTATAVAALSDLVDVLGRATASKS